MQVNDRDWKRLSYFLVLVTVKACKLTRLNAHVKLAHLCWDDFAWRSPTWWASTWREWRRAAQDTVLWCWTDCKRVRVSGLGKSWRSRTARTNQIAGAIPRERWRSEKQRRALITFTSNVCLHDIQAPCLLNVMTSRRDATCRARYKFCNRNLSLPAMTSSEHKIWWRISKKSGRRPSICWCDEDAKHWWSEKSS